MKHPTSDIQTDAIGNGTVIWQFCVVLKGAQIGNDCNINAHVFIENDVIIGNRVTVKSGVQLWNGLRIEDDVFIGPNTTFTNDVTPRSKQHNKIFLKTIIKHHASIGANATILPGITIGSFALIGAGSVVTKNVPDRALVMGNPSKITAWLNDDGTKMIKKDNIYLDNKGGSWQIINNQLEQIS